jgi:hypothetical protein
VKIKLMALLLAGTAGLGSSYALANDGNGHHGHDQKAANGSCQKAAVFGTASGPQVYTVTVTHSGWNSSLAPGQVVTLTVGQSGQPVHIAALGCVNGSSVTARSAFVVGGKAPETTTTATTTTATTATTTTGSTTTGSTTTTSTNHVVKSGGGKGGDNGRHGHRGHR